MTKLTTVEELKTFLSNYPSDTLVEICDGVLGLDSVNNKQLVIGWWTDSPINNPSKIVLKLVSL